MNICASEQRFWGKTDAETIQNAVDFAEKTGLGEVIIPRRNERTGENIWIIDKAVLLPSDMTVIVDNAHLRLADGVYENIFRNRNCRTPEGNTMDGEQFGINILGRGNALLDGGEHNGLVEQMHRDDPVKYPKLSVNLLIFFHNVRNFRVEGLNIVRSRWWSMCFIYCKWGHISDIDFRLYADHENQDGIDLRVGCEYITIENITGCTGDDTIAMTALPMDDLVPENELSVEGKSVNIHNIIIRNVISASHGCALVRFLCEDGAKIHHVLVDGLQDTGESVSGAAVFMGVGSTRFVKDHAHVMGDLRNITLRNIVTHGQRGLSLCEPVQDLLIENLDVSGRSEVGIRMLSNFACDNFTLRNFTFRGDPAYADTLFFVAPEVPENLQGFKAENVTAHTVKHIFRRGQFPVEDLRYENLTEEYFSNEKLDLTSVYGLYHRCSYGKVIENRAAGSRFEGEKK